MAKQKLTTKGQKPTQTKAATTAETTQLKRTLRLVRGHQQRNMETGTALAVDLMYQMHLLGGGDPEDFDMLLSVRVVDPKPGQKDKQKKSIKPVKHAGPTTQELDEAHSKAWHVLALWLSEHAPRETYTLLYDMSTVSGRIDPDEFIRASDRRAYRKEQHRAVKRINTLAVKLEAAESAKPKA